MHIATFYLCASRRRKYLRTYRFALFAGSNTKSRRRLFSGILQGTSALEKTVLKLCFHHLT